jgi:DNA polymerase-3 subunit epsilon
MTKLCFIDVETTGLDCKKNEIHQLSGIIDIDGKVKETFDFQIKPTENCIYDQAALELNNLTINDLQTDPNRITIYSAYQQLIDILSKYCQKFNKKDKFYFVGYNAHFDKDFMYEFFVKNNDKYFFSWMWGNHIDVMVLATIYLLEQRPEMENFKLINTVKQLGIELDEKLLHRSDYDIFLTREIYYKLIKPELYSEKQENKENMKETEIENNNLNNLMDDLLPYNTNKITTTNMTNIFNNYSKKVITYDSIMPFGKHKGESFETIRETDLNYLQWCLENLSDKFIFDQEIIDDVPKLIALEKPKRNNYTNSGISHFR